MLIALLPLLGLPSIASAQGQSFTNRAGHEWMLDQFQHAAVIIPENASEVLVDAAREFVALWEEATTKEINYGTENNNRAAIWLGAQVAPPEFVSPETLATLGDQGFVIKTYKPNRRDQLYAVGPHLVIAGNTDEATRNGVYEFYDRFLRKRWYNPAQTNNIILGLRGIPEIDLIYSPPFRFRELGYFGRDLGVEGIDRFRTRMRFTQPFQSSTRHPVNAPDAPVYDFDTLADAAVAWVKAQWAQPDTAQDTATRTVIWRDRSGLPVVCWTLDRIPGFQAALAAAWVEHPVSEIMALAESVAAALRLERPEEKHYVRLLLPETPPLPPADLSLSPEVVVQLSNIACDFSRPLADQHCPENRAFVEALAAWEIAAPNVFISDYICSLHGPHVPFPNLDIMQKNLYLYAKHGVTGVYMESWDDPRIRWSEMDDIRAYAAARLLWNPDQVVEDLAADIIQLRYPTASREITRYYRAFEEARIKSEAPMKVREKPAWLNSTALEKAAAALGVALKKNLPKEEDAHVRDLLSPLEYGSLVAPLEVVETAEGNREWRRPKSRSMEEVISRMKARAIGAPEVVDPLIDRIVEDCGGKTPARSRPYVEGQPPE